MLENPILSRVLNIVLPSIRINSLIYIPMTDEVLTKENLGKLPALDGMRNRMDLGERRATRDDFDLVGHGFLIPPQ